MSKTSRVLATGSNQITQGYKSSHLAVDLVKKSYALDDIVAHSDGTVVMTQIGIPNDKGSTGNRSYGNFVKIRHNGYYTLYAHLDSVNVRTGQTVKKGQKIGRMGNTGNSYGAHLHFELRNLSDVRLNPTPYLNADLPNNPSKDNTTTNKGTTTDTDSNSKVNVLYSAYADRKWLATVKDYNTSNSNGYAGIIGKAIQGIKIDLSEGDVYYRVHTIGGEWLPEVKNSSKLSSGYAGLYGHNIDCVQIRVPKGTIKYRVHRLGGGWYDWVTTGSKYLNIYDADGFAGAYGKPIDMIQIAMK